MATIDIRNVDDVEVDTIVFADAGAAHLEWSCMSGPESFARLYDDSGDHVVINDKQHALNLIKALNKAIELGWLK